ncbi:double-strand break repair protein AddB [Thermopetrobacter sp. TC1]|uniref:double-strand break repair protein AddB n=1 Tax=Thermopetrobacter sp. TC1 TaxID=1495045 RepID=UPI000571EB4D|nr:double-strand break repair protein AddB [Thermopetrobacter sp. TC1]
MTTTARGRPRVYTIPPDVAFLPALARAILSGNLPVPGGAPPSPLDLVNWTIWLPTRRTARLLAAELMTVAPSGAQVLARIHPLGDVDEDELALLDAAGQEVIADLPQPIPPVVRHFLLAELVREWAESDREWPLSELIRTHPGEALKMARALARLIDAFAIENLPLDALDALLDDDRPQHRLAARALLRHVRAEYANRLAERGYMDAAARRSRLIEAQAERYRSSPPDAPVIAAGSTGTIPATAQLLKVIAHMPLGCVILPGLDRNMDEKSWDVLPEGHPQYGMKRLLKTIGADRKEVEDLPGLDEWRTDTGCARAFLLSEVMRPAETSDQWPNIVRKKRDVLLKGSEGLNLLDADDRHEEARAIALLMRETLEREVVDAFTGEKRPCTAALITPDRALAQQVREELTRWGIAVDDSAGLPLADAPPGVFLKLLLDAALNGFPPEKLAPLAAHPFVCCGMGRGVFLERFTHLENAVLRALPSWPGIERLEALVQQRKQAVQNEPFQAHRAVRALSPEDWAAMHEVARALSTALSSLARQAAGRQAKPVDFGTLLRCLFETAEGLCTNDEGRCLLWEGEAGEALAEAVSDLIDHADLGPRLTLQDLALYLITELSGRPVRPPQKAQVRLFILGLLEARLVPADVKILGGLNEDIWPPAAEVDPFLNRPDKRRIDLPVPERRIGLTAHDFVQAAGNRTVWLTWAKRVDQQPAVPSRWILRLEALRSSLEQEAADRPQPHLLAWARALDRPKGRARPVDPPCPRPPVRLRPDSLSVTRVGLLMRAPYVFFAQQVLGLEPLDDLVCRMGARELGTAIHAALERFFRAHSGPDLPENAEEQLFAFLKEAFLEAVDDEMRLHWWSPRLERMAAWILEQEKSWRASLRRVHAEIEGRLVLSLDGGGAFTLTARADRLDLLENGAVRLLDFKTGQAPGKKPDSSDYDPQLDLEGAMALKGGFADIGPARAIEELAYVRLTGGVPPGEVKRLGNSDEANDRAREALNGLAQLMGAYAREDQAYLPVGFEDAKPYLVPFAHLARWQEWRHRLADEAEEGARAGEDEERGT